MRDKSCISRQHDWKKVQIIDMPCINLMACCKTEQKDGCQNP